MMETTDFKRGFVGRQLADKYVLQKPIGSGGMGSVYRGIQLGTEARVAVKLLSRDAPGLAMTSRFKQEAEMLDRH